MGARRDEKKNSRGTFTYSLEAKAARDEARALVEEARKIRDEILGRPAPIEAKLEASTVPAPEALKEPEVAPPQGA